MNVLSLSGGATKFIGIMSAARELIQRRGFKPQIICGVSSGSIVAMLCALGLFDVGVQLGLQLKLSTIFSSSPVNHNGRLTVAALFRAIIGRNYLGRMGNLEKNIRRVITPRLFAEYQLSKISPVVYVVAINASDKSRMAWNIKSVTYEKMIKIIMASCTMPMASPAVEIDGEFYYDGGIRDHSPGAWFCDNASERFTLDKLVAVYSRPENYRLPRSDKWKRNVLSLLSDFLIPTFNIEISKNDESIESNYCRNNGVKYYPVFIEPFVNNLFDVNEARLLRGLENGAAAVRKYYQP